jgi:putative membrane protein
MEAQVQAHRKTLADYQQYLKQGQDQQLRVFVSKVAPLIAEHLQMAEKMVGKGVSSGSRR